MAYKSLYRTYRPQTFDDVIGQEHIVQTLKNAIARDQLAHAYLFTGSRGTGKTTLAKLLAKGLNCLNPTEAPCNHCSVCESINQENHPDIIEIDAASNTGVDDVRDLIERVKYAPIEARKKVYIIDEVHMLSTGAFNALLKTLEEPPEHVVFILATTEVHKVLPTIISRCQRYDFTRISTEEITTNLQRVIEAEKLEVEDGVVEIIANLADGGHRDSLTILEQLIAYSHHPIKVQEIFDLYRLSTPEEKQELIEALSEKDLLKALESLKLLETKSIDYVRYIFDFVTLCKEFLVYSLSKNEALISQTNREVVKDLRLKVANDDMIVSIMNELLHIAQEARFNGQYQSYLEVMVMNLVDSGSVVDQPVSVQPKNDVVQVQQKPVVIEEEVQPKVEKPKESEKPKKTEPPKVMAEPESVDEDLILQLMVLGNKEMREKDTQLWNQKDNKLNKLKYRRLSRLIGNSVVGVSSDKFICLVTSSKTVSQTLNEETNLSLLYDLLQELGLRKKIFIIDIDSFKENTDIFLVKKENNELPVIEDINIDFSLQEDEAEQDDFDTQALLEETFTHLRIEE